MLFEKLTSLPATQAAAVVTNDATTSWATIQELAVSLKQRWQSLAGRRVGITVTPDARGIAAMAALDAVSASTFLFSFDTPESQLAEQSKQLNLDAVLTVEPAGDFGSLQLADESHQSASAASVTILTSGTEGRPKAASHTWESLSRPVRQTNRAQCWLLSYRIQLYAGLQVLLQALLNGGCLVIPKPDSSVDDIVELMVTAGVEYASATPSYWRRLLLFAERTRLATVPLQQITLGGEAIDQQILDSLSEVFPQSRLAHIYATTELGRCFSVTDRRAGFPASLLDRPSAEGIELKVRDDELLVRSSNRMQQYDSMSASKNRCFDDDGWFATGDLVEQRGDRVYFAGRKGDMINVGGNKVQPLEIESRLRDIDGIADVRVYAKSSSIAGQLVACDIVLSDGHDESLVRELISKRMDKLQSFQRPRFVQFVEQIELNAAGKTSRRS